MSWKGESMDCTDPSTPSSRKEEQEAKPREGLHGQGAPSPSETEPEVGTRRWHVEDEGRRLAEASLVPEKTGEPSRAHDENNKRERDEKEMGVEENVDAEEAEVGEEEGEEEAELGAVERKKERRIAKETQEPEESEQKEGLVQNSPTQPNSKSKSMSPDTQPTRPKDQSEPSQKDVEEGKLAVAVAGKAEDQQAQEQSSNPGQDLSPRQQQQNQSTSGTTAGKQPGTDAGDGSSSRNPARPSQLSRVMHTNKTLREMIKDNEVAMAGQQAIINRQRDELGGMRMRISEAQPRLIKLDAQLAKMQVEYAGMKEREVDAQDRAIAAGHARLGTTRETDLLRQQIKSLTDELTSYKERMEQVQATNFRMKDGFSDFVEVKLRNKVFEAENERLRTDLATGMERLQLLLQTQMEIGWELNEADARIRDQAERERMEALDAAGQLEDGAETLAHLGMKFRGSSIWEEDMQTGMVGQLPSPSAVASRTIVWSPHGRAHVGMQVLSPASPSGPSRSPLFRIGSMDFGELKKQRQRERIKTSSPLLSPIIGIVGRGTKTDVAPSSEVVKTIAHGTQATREKSQTPSSSPKVHLATDLPIEPTPKLVIPTQNSGSQISLLQTRVLPENHTTRSGYINFVPTLLLLFSAFFLALYADRLASERDVWVRANCTVRDLTTGWYGTERWNHSVGEWISWRTEVSERFEWAVIG